MPTTDATANPDELSRHAPRLAGYPRDEAADHEIYVKGKFISDDVGLSAKQIGAAMLQLQRASDLSIEKWADRGATTWRIETE